MKKILSFLLVCIILTQNLVTLANNPIVKETSLNLENNIASDKTAIVVFSDKQKDKNENFEEDFDEDYRPSKWEIAKNLSKYLGKAFIDDVKSYILFYPLFKVSQLISFLGLFFPTYVLYKKTGIDIPAKFSSFFNRTESLSIIGQNLYNLIPLTLASFLFKWGKDLYLYLRF